MQYGECVIKVRKILSQVNDEQELGLVEKLGDLKYGVLEKALSSDVVRFIASEFTLEADKQ